MPQDRTLLQQTATLTIERVVMHAPVSLHSAWSPSYEAASPRLVLPASGTTEFRITGEAGVLLDGLTALSLPCGLPYQMSPCAGASRAAIVVSERPDASMPASSWLPASHGGASWSLAPRALWLLRRHWRALARGDGRPEITAALLLGMLKQSPPALRGQARSAPVVRRAQRFMAEHVAHSGHDPWTLHDVADSACCSLFHLARAFRKHTGSSLHGYRQRLRLAVALQRLEEGERDIAALAHELGYSSQSHLGSVFVRQIGVTPAQARRVLAA